MRTGADRDGVGESLATVVGDWASQDHTDHVAVVRDTVQVAVRSTSDDLAFVRSAVTVAIRFALVGNTITVAIRAERLNIIGEPGYIHGARSRVTRTEASDANGVGLPSRSLEGQVRTESGTTATVVITGDCIRRIPTGTQVDRDSRIETDLVTGRNFHLSVC